MDKQVYKLAVDDFMRRSAWLFPIDDSVEDQLTVRPLGEEGACYGFQVVVRTRFLCANGETYTRYLHWGGNTSVEYLKPIMFMADGSCLCFWNGIAEPKWEDYPDSVEFIRQAFPISYASESVFEMSVIAGELEGLYYLGSDGMVGVSGPTSNPGSGFSNF